MADGASSPSSRSRRLPLVLQTEATECALACLSMVAGFYGSHLGIATLRRRFPTSAKGVNLTRLIDIAGAIGLQSRPIRAELAYLAQCIEPCILHWDMNHFVVLSRATESGIEIHDPARGVMRLSLEEASRHFTGVMIELRPRETFTRTPKPTPISLSAIIGRVSGLRRSMAQVFAIAAAIEVLSLTLPFQIQWVVDDVIVSSDTSLLLILTTGFLIILGLQGALTVARGWLLTWAGANMASQWTTNLFSHLMRLPMSFFERRQVGEILSRFSSVKTVQSTLTGTFVGAMLDGTMAIFSLTILSLYSKELTLIVVAFFFAYCLLRWAAYKSLWRVNEEMLACVAREQTLLLESVRGAQAIKLANGSSHRVARMANAATESVDRDMKAQRIGVAFSAISQCLAGGQRTTIICIGAWLAIRHSFSIGMLIAFVAYADQFSTKVATLVDRIIDLRMLRLHIERIADIVTTRTEDEGSWSATEEIEPSISLNDIGFRYSADDRWIFRHVSFTIHAGESVAIVGSSGCGKSTLAKAILGLLPVEEGDIHVGSHDLKSVGLHRYRDMIGCVMQNDHLFTGTITENITTFASHPDMTRVIEAATAANIHADISLMPMGYDAYVGDMGSTLSGGQKQRLLLARALYKKPGILLLDEATSHLDHANELIVNENIARMKITRIIIAHRAETIASADRVIDFEMITNAPREGKSSPLAL